jgi:hypothetical protein
LKLKKKCNECDGTNIRMTTVWAGGGYAPDLLPGTHPWWKSGKLEIYICETCGHFQFFVPAEILPDVLQSKEFKPA